MINAIYERQLLLNYVSKSWSPWCKGEAVFLLVFSTALSTLATLWATKVYPSQQSLVERPPPSFVKVQPLLGWPSLAPLAVADVSIDVSALNVTLALEK
jgi:hypothetical protein